MGATITFAIPFYKQRTYLEKAVQSVFAQTVTDWRLLISDESPAGEAAELLRKYDDPRMQISRNDGARGMAENWNRCLDIAETDLVTLLHEDDELLPWYANVMVRALARDPRAAAMSCRARVIDAAGRTAFSFVDRFKDFLKPVGRTPCALRGPGGIADLLRGNFIMCPTVCYRRQRIGARRFDPHWKFVLDLDFFTRLLGEGESIVVLPEVAYAYRRHTSNTTVAYTANLLRFREEVSLYERLEDRALKNGWADVSQVAHGKRMIQLHLLFRTLSDATRGRFREAREKLAYLTEIGTL